MLRRGTQGSGTISAFHTAMADSGSPTIGELLKRIVRDLHAAAGAELQLTQQKMVTYLEQTVLKISVVIIGGFVAAVGLAMLCVVAVLVLQPFIQLIWMRLVLMSVVYLLVGGGAVVMFARRAGPNAASVANRAP